MLQATNYAVCNMHVLCSIAAFNWYTYLQPTLAALK